MFILYALYINKYVFYIKLSLDRMYVYYTYIHMCMQSLMFHISYYYKILRLHFIWFVQLSSIFPIEFVCSALCSCEEIKALNTHTVLYCVHEILFIQRKCQNETISSTSKACFNLSLSFSLSACAWWLVYEYDYHHSVIMKAKLLLC